jgi:hypothetical protein
VNNIDFLPQSYHEKRRERTRAYRRWLCVAVVFLVLLGWGTQRYRDSAVLSTRAYGLEAQVQLTLVQLSEKSKLTKENNLLEYQLKLQRQLDQPVAVTQAMAVLGRLLPASSGFTRVHIQTDRPAPQPRVDPGKKKGKRKSKPGATQKVARDSLVVEVYGLAPDDIAVTDLVNEMSDHPLFTKVQMRYSQVAERSGLVGRKFLISAEVPLDRRYLPTGQTAEATDED